MRPRRRGPARSSPGRGAHLTVQDVRWLHTSRQPNAPFPGEAGWAESRPDLFALRYADETNRIYEFLPVARRVQ